MPRIELAGCEKCSRPLFLCKCLLDKTPRFRRQAKDNSSENAKWTCLCGERVHARNRYWLVHREDRWCHRACAMAADLAADLAAKATEDTQEMVEVTKVELVDPSNPFSITVLA